MIKVILNGALSRMDITNEWIRKKKKGSITEKQSYIIDGVEYIVDGKHVKLKPSEKERAVATILSEQYGKAVELVPQVVTPQLIQTPDYIIDGERFDLKSPEGEGKDLFYNMVSKKRKQAPNFVFDVTDCPLSDKEIERQIKNLYFSKHTQFIDKIVLLRDGEILKVYSRNK